MTNLSTTVERLLPELVADPWAGSAAARAVMELGPRGIHALLRILARAPADTQARGLFVADGLLLEFHARRLLEQRTQVVLAEDVSPRQALSRISEQLGMDVETADAPISDLPTLRPGRFALAELLTAITAQMPGWSWRQDVRGRVFLQPGHRPQRTGVHVGPFHVEVTSLALTRRWDATGRSIRTDLQVALGIERPLQKLIVPTLTLQRVEEDNGQQHELPATQTTMRHEDSSLHATFSGPQARAEQLRALWGQVSGKFPISYDQGELNDLASGATIDTLNGPICIEHVTDHDCRLRFAPPDAARAIESAEVPEGIGLSLLMLGIDSQHRAAIGRMQRLSSYTPGSDAADPPNVVWTASFHDPAFPDFGPLRHLRYRTIAKVAELTYPFCIRDIPIP